MQKITDITKTAVEDGVEDYISAVLYGRMREFTKPFLNQFDSESEFDEAMQSFINTLSMGLTLYAYNILMTYFFERGVKITVAMWTYIVAGSFKKRVIEKLKSKNLKGKRLLNTASMILGSDRTAQRIEVVKMAQENVKSFDTHKFHYQNQHSKIDNKIDTFSLSASSLKSTAENSYLTRFTHKTMTGTWENTNLDKKLYQKATGITLAETGAGSWSSLYEKLNKFNEFAKDVDGEITNLATSMQMILSKNGLIK